MSKRINITSKGIQKVLKSYTVKQAVAEYIWNGFDANADQIIIDYEANALGLLEKICITDNGYGINHGYLNTKFAPFFDSEKANSIAMPKHTSKMHGRNGVGRLTFFTFAHSAKWVTTYKDNEGYHSGSITIETGALNAYTHDFSGIACTSGITGTTVSFANIRFFKQELENSVLPFLIGEFCWFLELNSEKNYRIIVNGNPLNFQHNIYAKDSFEIKVPNSDTIFRVKYVQWREALHKEFSKYYFMANGEEIYKDFTTLNKQGDDYFHSVYIDSEYFLGFDFRSQENATQVPLFSKVKSSMEYKFLINELSIYIKKRRLPLLEEHAEKLVAGYEDDGIFPTYTTEWELKFRKPELTAVIKTLYQVEPKLFSCLNTDQKKTFVRLLDIILDNGERESIFAILNEVVHLEPQQRNDLANLFEYTKLNRITDTIKLLAERFEVYYKLKDLVFNVELKADEVNHLQKLIEDHYWIFGEQYHLVTAAEPKFQEALRRYNYLLTKNDQTNLIDHPHKLKEMDIFACRQNRLADRIENIVVELKHPRINLGASQYHQVYNYIDVISKQPEFNASNMYWEFHLIGNKFDTSDFIKNQINTNRPHGLRSLALLLDEGRIKFFVKTWSEVFAEFEIRHSHLDTQLKLEREKLFNQQTTAAATVKSVTKKNTGST